MAAFNFDIIKSYAEELSGFNFLSNSVATNKISSKVPSLYASSKKCSNLLNLSLPNSKAKSSQTFLKTRGWVSDLNNSSTS
jgi:hypothetical protein